MKIKILIPMLFLITSIIVCTVLFIDAYADVNLKLKPINGPIQGIYHDNTISIQISNSCLALNLNPNSPCPDYFLLYLNGLDSSVIQSGSFEWINDSFRRNVSNIKNEERLYEFVPFTLILDPSYRMEIKTKTIYLVPSLDSFIPKEALVKVNNTRTVYKNISVDENCRYATVSSTNWIHDLPKMIFYLRSNCDTKYFSIFDSKDVITDNSTNIDITTTNQYKYNLWLEEAKQKSKSEFLIK